MRHQMVGHAGSPQEALIDGSLATPGRASEKRPIGHGVFEIGPLFLLERIETRYLDVKDKCVERFERGTVQAGSREPLTQFIEDDLMTIHDHLMTAKRIPTRAKNKMITLDNTNTVG